MMNLWKRVCSQHVAEFGMLVFSILFGVWFAAQQSFVLSADYFATPFLLFLATAVRVGLCVLFLCFFCALLLRYGRSIFGSKLWRLDGLAFGIMVLVHVLLNIHESPLVWHLGQLATPGNYTASQFLVAPLYKAVTWIRQFSLSDMDYAYFAAVPRTPVDFSSALFTMVSWAFPVSSLDPQRVYVLFHAVLFIITLVGSLGYYLFARYALRLDWWISMSVGAASYFVAGIRLWDLLFGDYFLFLSVWAALPYVWWAMQETVTRRSHSHAVFLGVALALPFFLLAPHPDFLVHLFLISTLLGGVLLCCATEIAWRQKMILIFAAAVSFVCVSAAYWVPLLTLWIGGDISVVGHRTQSALPADRLAYLALDATMIPYAVIAFVSVVVVMLAWLFRAPAARRFLPWMCGFLLAFLLYVPMFPVLLMRISEWAHVPLNFDHESRRYFLAALFVLMMAAMAVHCLMDAVRAHANIRGRERPLVLMRVAVTLMGVVVLLCGYPAEFVREFHAECPYYVSMRALRANYPLLAKDAKSLQEFRTRLTRFERDVVSARATEYGDAYRAVLATRGVGSAAEIADSELLAFVREVESGIDGFYGDIRYSCVSPYHRSNLGDNRRAVNFNLPALYADIPSVFSRIVGLTHFTQTDENIYLQEDIWDSHMGVGPGLFLHNNSTSFDARFMVASPLLHALYVFPDHVLSPLGNYTSRMNWRLSAQWLVDPEVRRLFDISGMDWFVLHARNRHLLASIPNVEILDTGWSKGSKLEEFSVLRNTNSYGLAYVAHQAYNVAPSQVLEIETTVDAYVQSQRMSDSYLKAIATLHRALGRLEKYDVILERTEPLLDDLFVSQGEVRIQNVLGEATLMNVQCRTARCMLVYNQAKLPAWKAYVGQESVPIERANFAFMAISVPEGEHRVWFVYLDWVHVSASLLTLLALCFVARRKWLEMRLTSSSPSLFS